LIEATGWQSFFLFHRLPHRVRPLRDRGLVSNRSRFLR
jgi:hypothetical protein